MEIPRSVRTAAMVSQILIVVWVLAALLVHVFQESLIRMLYIPVESENIFLWDTMALFFASIVLSVCNILLRTGSARKIPLIAASVTIGFMPVLSYALRSIQNIVTSRLNGVEEVAKCSALEAISSVLSFILYAAAVITVASGAVCAYIHGLKNTKSEFINKTENLVQTEMIE